MKVSLIEPLNVSEEIIQGYKKQIEDLGHEFTYYNEKTTDKDELVRRSLGQDIVMIANNPYPAEVITQLDDLKLLNVAFTGVDHVGLDSLKEKKIDLCNASGYSDIAVAELVLGLVIGLYRNMIVADSSVRQSGLAIMGKEISGKTVGIIGTGNIGLKTANLFTCLGAKVIGYDLTEDPKFLGLGGEYESIENLLRTSDIISIHLPNTVATRSFIGKEELDFMKESAILINCARGPIVDNEALAKALDQGEIAGAGVDVFDMEPPIPLDYPLLKAKNTILTPHLAYLSQESMLRRAKIAFDNTLSYLKGQGKNLIDL